MTGQFKIWFTLEATHGYFLSGGGPLSFEPTARTAALLKRLGMMVRVEKSRLLVAFSSDRAEDYLSYLDGEINDKDLCFKLVNATDARFYNYTHLDFPGKGWLLSFSNTRATPTGNGFGLNRISNEQDGFVPFASSIQIDDGDKLTDTAGNELLVNKSNLCDFRAEPEGEYLLSKASGDQQLYAFYEKGMSALPVGIISLKMDAPELVAVVEKVSKSAVAEHLSFQIQFEARKTTWKYILRERNEDRDLSKYRVFGKDEKDFEKVEDANDMVFQSVEPIALSEVYTQVFSLRNGQAGKAIIERLPGADSQIIFPEIDKGIQKVYSEIYVYI